MMMMMIRTRINIAEFHLFFFFYAEMLWADHHITFTLFFSSIFGINANVELLQVIWSRDTMILHNSDVSSKPKIAPVAVYMIALSQLSKECPVREH